MYLTDYHIHTKYSFDCEEDIEKICEKAIQMGMKEIALTDHMDIYTGKPYGHILDCENWYKALNEIKEKYKGKLKIARGIEIGTPQANPSEAKAFLDKYKLDFIIGSIHTIDNDEDVAFFDFEKLDYKQVYANYIQWLIKMAKEYDFDSMGHITYPSRYVIKQLKIEPDIEQFREEFIKLFKILVENGKGIEINMSEYTRGGDFSMPPIWLVKLYKECGGEIITTGSDSHIYKNVGTTSKLAYEMIKEAGFDYITTFEDRKAQFYKI